VGCLNVGSYMRDSSLFASVNIEKYGATDVTLVRAQQIIRDMLHGIQWESNNSVRAFVIGIDQAIEQQQQEEHIEMMNLSNEIAESIQTKRGKATLIIAKIDYTHNGIKPIKGIHKRTGREPSIAQTSASYKVQHIIWML